MNHSGTFVTTRSAEEAFDLVADPHRFAPLQPGFESISIMDATHFSMRIAIAVGQVRGHVNLAMELREAARPSRVAYRGQGIVAGSDLAFAMQFDITPSEAATQVNWQGEVSVDGMLAFMAGGTIESTGRKNFELMAQRLQDGLSEGSASTDSLKPDSETIP
jgi:carbon monoxide dehydrogenase subunit G